jgi:DNA mismatch repair protein MutS
MSSKHSHPETAHGTEPFGGHDRETPLMAQYNQIKAAQPDALLLFRVGDFYETFGSDAVVVAGVLGIVLTKRNNGGSDVELAGFPYHSLDMYLPRLVRAGHRVAICDQLEKPSKEKKIVRRGITEVVTPGVATGDHLLDTRTNNFLACVHPAAKGLFGVAFLDVSTGEFLVAEGDAAYLDKLFQSFQPSEILYPKGRKRDLERLLGDKAYLYGLDEWIFTEDYARGKLLEQFEVANLKGFGVEELAAAQIAAGAALHYLGSIEINNRKHFTHLSRILPDRYVWLDRFTVRNLELVHTPHEQGRTLLSVLDHTVTPMGTRLLKKWVALPLKERKAVEARHDIVRHLIDKGDDASAIEQQLRQVGDLERLVSKAPLGKLSPREMRQLLRSLVAIEGLQQQLSAIDNTALQGMAERMNPCPTLRDRIQRELHDDPPTLLSKGNVIADGVSEELDELRNLIRNSKEILLDIQRREAQQTGITNLKIGFNSVFGYYLEVTNKHKDNSAIPREWIRKQTLANAERYVTEELKILESKILGAEDNILALEEKLFADLVFTVQDYLRPIQLNASLCAQLDCLLSFAKVAVRHNYCRPQLNDGLSIQITEGRHPVIEQQLPIGEPYVPNDIFLSNDEQQIMVLTGPNMAGKSALLRQTALICLMAQMGSFVPAKTARLGMLDKVFTRVGASDNMSAGESTFMVEMTETASILNNITERSLILLDEIGRGTSTYDGISIAWSIAEYLHENDFAHPKTLFATHYHELNELAERFDRARNFHVATKEVGNKVIFLRKLQPGGTQHSFGIHVARMAGMPRPVVERSAEILEQLEKKHIDGQVASPAERLRNAPARPVQLSIFDAPAQDPALEAIREALEDLDLNRMTPVDCMMKLLDWKKMLEGPEKMS